MAGAGGRLRGMSPLLAREIAFRALGHPRARHAVERLTPLLEAIGNCSLLCRMANGIRPSSGREDSRRSMRPIPYPSGGPTTDALDESGH